MKLDELNKYRRLILIISVIAFSLLLIGVSEVFLARYMGLGEPVLYDSSPIYGYRPLPGKTYSRFYGKEVKFNNLGLRSESDWNEDIEDKILFLGDSVTYGGSYISNTELFSYLSVKNLGNNYVSGNAGVNAWGVENIYGLIVESGFMPAGIYVTVIPESDFYRGLTRIHGLPFYNEDPKYAFQELFDYFIINKNNNKRYKGWQHYADKNTKAFVIEKAVKKLKMIDVLLKEKGYKHLIFISPKKRQVIKHLEKDLLKKDPLVKKFLTKHGLFPFYIKEK